MLKQHRKVGREKTEEGRKRGKLEINKKEETEIRKNWTATTAKGGVCVLWGWGGAGIHSEWKMQEKIKNKSAIIFYKHFIMSRQGKRYFATKDLRLFFSLKWFEWSNIQYLYSNLYQAFINIKFEHQVFVLITSNPLWN